MANSFREGLSSGLGYMVALVLVIGGIALMVKLVEFFKKEYKKLKKRPQFVLDNWKTYEQKGYFEELAIFCKYKEKLKKGEWPDELEGMFEWVDTENVASTDNWGDVYIYKKSILALKTKYKADKNKKKEEAKKEASAPKDKGDKNDNGDNKAENKDDKQ